MNAEKLSDYQLYTLVMKNDLDINLKDLVSKEFLKRNISQEKIDQFDIKFRKQNLNNESLSLKEKIIIVIFPFGILIHSILATRHIKKGNKRRVKQHWNYMTLGYFLWLFVLITFVWIN